MQPEHLTYTIISSSRLRMYLPDGMHLSLHSRLNSDPSMHSRTILRTNPRYFRHGGSAGLFVRGVCVCISRVRDSQSPSEIANIIHFALETPKSRPRQQTLYNCDTVHKAILVRRSYDILACEYLIVRGMLLTTKSLPSDPDKRFRSCSHTVGA